MSNTHQDACDVCGDPITPANVGQCTGDDVICSDCLPFAAEQAEAGPPPELARLADDGGPHHDLSGEG